MFKNGFTYIYSHTYKSSSKSGQNIYKIEGSLKTITQIAGKFSYNKTNICMYIYNYILICMYDMQIRI